jgi:aspartate-semialdehyde dehydrogenase
MANKLLIVDPLTLMGREILQLLEGDSGPFAEIAYVHTAEDDEHQIAELGGEPALVPPLSGADELAGCSAVVVASDEERPRLEHVHAFIRSDDSTTVIDVSRTTRLRADTGPAALAEDAITGRHLHIVHPAIVMTAVIARALRDLEPCSGTVAAVDPVSSLSDAAVEALARQAAQRLSGAQVEEMVDDKVLAFTLVAVEDHELNEDAAILLPELDLGLSRSLVGRFHGNVAHIGLRFNLEIDDAYLHDLLGAEHRVVLCDTPMSLDSITESNEIAIGPPRISRDRHGLALTALADGLRIGGAVTLLEILRSKLEPTN